MPERPERVVLVGFMGAGKSTIGRRLAKRLGFAFVDLDRRIEVRAGRKIAAIFQEQGEAAFRELELEESRALASLTRVVVATGGGAFAQDATRNALQQGAFTVWLQCSLGTAQLPDRHSPIERHHWRRLHRFERLIQRIDLFPRGARRCRRVEM